MARPDPFIGKVLDDRYRLVEKIGAGGFGAVYKADHLRLGSPFAIKFMFPMLAQDEALIARFEREAKTTSLLHHPHIVDVVDFGEQPVLGLYLVMEYLVGETLRQRVRRDGARDTATILRIADPICQALVTAHEHGVIHRDLKPANIFLIRTATRDDFVKILDFGIAGLVDDGGKGLTKTGMIMGSPPYMSPEQAWARKLDHRTDIYSLGVVLYEMATGATPFRGESDVAVLDMHRSATPEPPRRFRPDLDIPAGLEKVILRCLAKSPDERYPTIRAVWRDLAGLGVDLGVSGMTAIVGPTPDEPADNGATALFLAAPETTDQQAIRVASDGPQPSGTAATGAGGSAQPLSTMPLPAREPASPSHTTPLPSRAPEVTSTATPYPGDGSTGEDVRAGRRPLRLGIAAAAAAVVVTALLVFWPGGKARDVVLANGEERPAAATAPGDAPPSALERVPQAAAPDAPVHEALAPAVAVDAAVVVPAVDAGSSDTAAPPDVARAPEPTRLLLTSRPAGATVHLGEEELCRTPCDVRVAPADGEQTLRFQLRGYEDGEAPVPFVAGGTVDREIELRRAKRERGPRRATKPEAAPRPSPGVLPGIRLDQPKKPDAPAALPKLRVE